MTAMCSEWMMEIGVKHYWPDCYEFDEETDKYKPKKVVNQ